MAIDVPQWLRGLGLEEHARAFANNDIDGSVLPELTSEDLAALGVTSVGQRRKLLSAIAALRGGPPAIAPATSASLADAERRQITIMFCDLAGSTELSSRYDPEDLREMIAAYQRRVAETVARFAGFVAKYMGDGVLVYFGYPQSHEDDAERAVRAGLAVIDAVGRLDLKERLAVRLGVASGLAVVGDLIGEGAARERGVVGATPNLAARLQAIAPPDALAISGATRRLVGNLFECRDLGAVTVKGFDAPVQAWLVLNESAVESRFEALHGETTLTPFVEREEELELLMRRWRRTVGGEGQVALLSGEAGIGKSRLLSALRDRLAGETHTELRLFCSPQHESSALYPFIAQLERAAGFARDDSVDARLDKLEALLAPSAASREELALLAELLSLPAESRYPPLGLSPQRKKENTFAALLRLLEATARRQPVLFICEDLHWIDPSSRELLDRIIERAAALPVLLVATHRPEFVPPWNGLPQVTTMTLTRFDRRAAMALVDRIAGGAALAREVAAEIVERADGVPLFVEELTKAVIEAGGSGEAVAKTLAGALSSTLMVPAALHAPLMARLDRLGPAREGNCPDRGRDRPRLLVSTVGADRRPRRERTGGGAWPARRCRPRFLSGHAARGNVSVQARAGPRRGLCQPVAPPPRRTARQDRPGARNPAFPKRSRRSLNSWPSISPRRGFPSRRSPIGSAPANARSHARPTSKRSRISVVASRF